MPLYNRGPAGLGDVGSYQVSGKPFVSGAINVTVGSATAPLEISFPSVTQWIIIRNLDTDGSANEQIKISASPTGFANGNYFRMFDDYTTSFRRHSRTPRMEMKLTKIYLTGSSTHVDVIAGLTSIPTDTIPTNWSGSEGVG